MCSVVEEEIVRGVGQGFQVGGPQRMHTTLVLSFAQLSGESAESVAAMVYDKVPLRLTAQQVWVIHDLWSKKVMDHQTPEEAQIIRDHMVRCITEYNATQFAKFSPPSRPLSRTPEPLDFAYAPYLVLNGAKIDLFPNYCTKLHFHNQNLLVALKQFSESDNPTHLERMPLSSLGIVVQTMLKKYLHRWFGEALRIMANLPFNKKATRSEEMLRCAHKYLLCFQKEWERVFGLMRDREFLLEQVTADRHVLLIRSPSAAMRIFFLIMMSDRILALEKREMNRRMETGLQHVNPDHLPEDMKECPICREPMGALPSVGPYDAPVRLLSCCGTYLGEKCLVAWVVDAKARTCPTCRARLPAKVINKLKNRHDPDDDNNDLNLEKHFPRVVFPTYQPRTTYADNYIFDILRPPQEVQPDAQGQTLASTDSTCD